MKRLISIILLILICIVLFCNTVEVNAKLEPRFEMIDNWGNGITKLTNFTFYDKQTKVIYYYIQKTGIIMLVDSEGKPLLYEGE